MTNNLAEPSAGVAMVGKFLQRVDQASPYIEPVQKTNFVASILGAAFFIALNPGALLPPILLYVVLIGIPIGYLLAMPVTFLLLPLCAALLRKWLVLRQLLLPLVGLSGGIAMIWWLPLRGGFEIVFAEVAAATGFFSGMFYCWRIRASIKSA